MTRKALTIPLAASLGLALLFLLTLALSADHPAVSAAEALAFQPGTGIIRVSLAGSDTAGCGSAATPCQTIQYAVNLAQTGDEVRVAQGLYDDVNVCDGQVLVACIAKTITLRGGYDDSFSAWDPELYVTTLDAGGWGRVLVISGTVSPTVQGLVITGGDATGLGGDLYGDAGGGVYVLSATATLLQNTICGNVASRDSFEASGVGGGVYLRNSNARLLSNTVSSNVAADGGMLADGQGGGVFARGGAPLIRGNLVVDNDVVLGGSFFATGSGGGLYLAASQPTIEANQIRNNTAGGGFGTGGGLELAAAPDFLLVNNVIADNLADYGGSGVYIGALSGVPSRGRLLHSTIARNQPMAGVRVVGGSVVSLTNTILVEHGTGINVSFGSTATLEATLWGSGAWANDEDWGDVGDIFTGTVNVWGDPVFVDPANGDYHIVPGSAAVDQGMAAGVTHDLDGNLRDADPDLGAYEAGVAGAIRVGKASSTALAGPSDRITYTIRVTNSGATLLPGVTVSDLVPSEQQILAAQPDQGNCNVPPPPNFGGLITCELGNLAVGEAATVTIKTQVIDYAPAGLPLTMTNNVAAFSGALWAMASSDVILQNCRARVNGQPPTYASVQAAVDAAGPGDAVWIAGACAGASLRDGSSQQVYVNKNLSLRGGYAGDFSAWNPAANPTTLDALGQGRVLTVIGPASVTVEALRLTGGDATGQGGLEQGFADAGGGVYAIDATLTLSGCQVNGNLASANFDGFGGGIAVTTATLTLMDTAVTDNLATRGGFVAGYGGGLFAQFADLHLARSRFAGNAAAQGLLGQGGGAYIYSSTLNAEATLWLSNTVSGSGVGLGGGLTINGRRPFTLTNCVVAGNLAGGNVSASGSGLLIEDSHGLLLQPTIARNQPADGIGLAYTSSVTISNAIIVSQAVGIWVEPGSSATLNGVLWHDNISNTIAVSATLQTANEHSGDPALAPDGYHLRSGSAAVNQGSDSGVASDVDGHARPQGAGYDLGADERPLCSEDVNADGQINTTDIQLTALGWGGQNPLLDIDENGLVDIIDILRVAGRWMLGCP